MISESESIFFSRKLVRDDQVQRDCLRARALQYRWMGYACLADTIDNLISEREQAWVWAAV